MHKTRRKTPQPELWDEKQLTTRSEGCKAFLEGEIESSYERVLRLIEPLPGERILDIGCGAGVMVREFARMTDGAVGIDYSLAAIKLSKGYVGARNIIRANATHLPFKNQVFDKITMLGLINHLDEEDLQMCLQESKRVLKQEGRILIATPNSWEAVFHVLATVYSLLFRHERLPLRSDYHTSPHRVNSKNYLSLGRILKKCGFEPRIWFDTQSKGKTPSIVYRILFFARPLWCIAKKRGH